MIEYCVLQWQVRRPHRWKVHLGRAALEAVQAEFPMEAHLYRLPVRSAWRQQIPSRCRWPRAGYSTPHICRYQAVPIRQMGPQATSLTHHFPPCLIHSLPWNLLQVLRAVSHLRRPATSVTLIRLRQSTVSNCGVWFIFIYGYICMYVCMYYVDMYIYKYI